MTKEQLNSISVQRGIFAKLFKYLEFKGILYTTPSSATMEGWDKWRAKVKKEYPIQYFIRDKFEDIEYWFISRYKRIRYWVKTALRPENSRIRAAIPIRGSDLCAIITEMNFALILQFKEEADKSIVDWDAHETHKEFKDWLDRAALWITEGRPNLEKELQRAYPEASTNDILTVDLNQVKDLYSEVHRLEELIAQTDENIIIQMVKYRGHFWT
jgi:hypothetical protein